MQYIIYNNKWHKFKTITFANYVLCHGLHVNVLILYEKDLWNCLRSNCMDASHDL